MSEYLPFIKHPILIFKAESEEEIKRAFDRAKSRELHIGIYTEPLFATKNEEENLIEIAKCTDAECLEMFKLTEDTRCILSYERTFLRPVFE